MPDRMDFELIGAPFTDIETIGEYGRGRWRKLKGITLVRRPNGFVYRAEMHWYEAHGIGQRRMIGRHRMKVKRLLEREEGI